MRKAFLLTLLLISMGANAQFGVTKFLGIPVDGTKSEMISKLKAKGFVQEYGSDFLKGEFNGHNVEVHVVTNNNKVYRIVLHDENTRNETDIKIRFNRLCEQFENNPKYFSFGDQKIPDDENIGYEILVNKKRYEASFFQQPEIIDSTAVRKELELILRNKYTEEQINNPTEEIGQEIISLSASYMLKKIEKNSVWFMISEFNGKYYITMFYDNGYNMANGEDL